MKLPFHRIHDYMSTVKNDPEEVLLGHRKKCKEGKCSVSDV